MSESCVGLRRTSGGVLLDVQVVPRAKREGVVGRHGGCLKVAVKAPPVEGRANAAVAAVLAELFGCPSRAVTVVKGAGARKKTLHIEGVEFEAAAGIIDAALNNA